ncbi:hypothetical protein C8R43DRAFT_969537 [Mycena crocata]|nr:hypothetical protein C8R43DRAFT_969537 [Mycena crocata]
MQHTTPLPTLTADAAPIIMINICRAWTTIALSTPKLWANIYISLPKFKARSHGFPKLIEAWLSRAGPCTLNIALEALRRALRMFSFNKSTVSCRAQSS